MATPNVNSDNRTADLLADLRRHLKACHHCTSAFKASDRSLFCDHTLWMVTQIAWQYGTLIPRRLKVARSGGDRVYACPDMSAHGKAWCMTAEPLIVTGVQDELF